MITFKIFYDFFLALELSNVLKENDIKNIIESSNGCTEPLTMLYKADNRFEVKLFKEDLNRADHLLQKLSLKVIENLPSDYYLHQFTDEELYEVIVKKHEWNQLDYTFAKIILKNRGKEIYEE